jgi:hypothetical protein
MDAGPSWLKITAIACLCWAVAYLIFFLAA